MAQKFSREIEIHACKKADERSLHEATAEACEVKSPWGASSPNVSVFWPHSSQSRQERPFSGQNACSFTRMHNQDLYFITLTGEVTANIWEVVFCEFRGLRNVLHVHMQTHTYDHLHNPSTNDFTVPLLIQFLSGCAWKHPYTVLRLLLFFPLVTLKTKWKRNP